MSELRAEVSINLVLGDTIETTDEAILDALRRCHAGEDPELVFDGLRRRSDEDDEE